MSSPIVFLVYNRVSSSEGTVSIQRSPVVRENVFLNSHKIHSQEKKFTIGENSLVGHVYAVLYLSWNTLPA